MSTNKGIYTLTELLGMKAKRLQEIADERGLGLKFNKSHNIETRAKRILAAEFSRDVEAQAAVIEAPAGSPPREANPIFEQKCASGGSVEAAAAGVQTGSAPTENRGGARPGAGRPLGMTDERSRATHVSEKPHPVVQALFEGLFAAWSVATGCAEVALTKEEAADLALPWTQALDYLGYTQYIPEWAKIFFVASLTTFNTIKLKSRLAREHRKSQPPVQLASLNTPEHHG
jgi:hypothetical protein